MSSRDLNDLRQEVKQMALAHIDCCHREGVDLKVMKICTVCGTKKDENLFEKKKARFTSRCKDCRSKYSKEHYRKNIAAIRIRHKEYRDKTKPTMQAYSKIWRKDNKEKCVAYTQKYLTKYPEKRKAIMDNWVESNIEKKRACYRSWAKRNQDAVQSKNAKRRAIKIKAAPSWFSAFDVFVFQEARKLAKNREETTGFKWEVDHIVPLNSKEVCGFHCASNFRVIPKQLNSSKGNRRTTEWENRHGF